jgi:glycosyltransferase involved in cell wall biosynthesis
MTRVLLITDIFPPQVGGPATFIDRLGHALSARGHRVTVVCSTAANRTEDRQRPFAVRRVTPGGRLVFPLAVRAVLAREMLRHSLIFVNGLEVPAYQTARALRRTYVLKIVGDVVWETARNLGLTSLSVDDFQTAPLHDPLLRRLHERRSRALHHARRIVVPSQYLHGMVAGWGVAAERVTVIPNGVLLHDSPPAPAARHDAEPLMVAFCGRLTNWKGVETLLLAVAEMSGVRLRVIGDGPELPLLTELARQLRLGDRVEFRGRLAGAALHEAMASAHALALPSGYEGLSHTLLEAFALGLPVIASACGGNRELVESESNGLLVAYGDVAQMRQALQRLRDEPARLRMAEQSLRTSRRYDFEQTLRETTAVITGRSAA